MKVGPIQLRNQLRLQHLELEAEVLQSLGFHRLKDWDSDPTVIWEGKLKHATLTRSYEIQLHYMPSYPISPPKVFPKDKKIRRNRHQNPADGNLELPGDICIFQPNLSDWVVGIRLPDILNRAINWFYKYENGALDQEPAPPEIERYFPPENRELTPLLVLSENLLKTDEEQSWGAFRVSATNSGLFAFFATAESIRSIEAEQGTFNEVERISNIVASHDPLSNDGPAEGYYFKITSEPFEKLPLSVNDLLKTINNENQNVDLRLLSELIMRNDPRYIALYYEEDGFPNHWLIFKVEIRMPKSSNGGVKGFRWWNAHWALLHVNKKNPIKLMRTSVVSQHTLFSRNLAHGGFQQKSVLVLGVGSLGSRVIELITKAGISNLTLIDNDIMEAGNVSRHVLGLDYLGHNKATAMKHFLRKINPFMNIVVRQEDLADARFLSKLTRAIDEADLVISCLGNDSVETWISQLLMLKGRKGLFSRLYALSTIGEIFLVNRGMLCFSCLSKYLMGTTDIPRPPSLDFSERIKYDGADCGTAFIPGSAVDIDMTASHTARIAIDILQERDLFANYWLVRGRSFNTNWDFDPRIESPFSLHEYLIDLGNSCSICSHQIKN